MPGNDDYCFVVQFRSVIITDAVALFSMGKINNIQLRAQAVILAKEGYSHDRIARKLNRTKWWVTKWVGRSICDENLVDKSRSGRSRILSNAAKRIIQAAKYRRGHSLRRMSLNKEEILSNISYKAETDVFHKKFYFF